ncbi:MAG: NAD(P)/FAD-dependent oxidoreductase [Eubacterium sp.]|nr:NAD(P)/FAD-dependent oxidoreductase [Eubacterium sp.]
MKKKVYDTAVIGAGASGIMAAVTAARLGAEVVLLEHMEQAAKKLLATGNGKCNYTNTDQAIGNYYCEEPAFVRTVLEQFPYTETIRFFEELGIRPVQKNGTCIYPESEQAASVKSALLSETERLQIPLLLSVGIRRIHKLYNQKIGGSIERQLFQIETKGDTIYSRTCILATGGKAAKKTGSDGSGYLYARQLGHTLIQPFPALTALLADLKKWKLPAGVRIGCTAALYVDGVQRACETGELQITESGISGIVVFQFSRTAAKALAENRQVHVCLDFKPNMPQPELAAYLLERFLSIYHSAKRVDEGMVGFLPDKLIPVVRKRAGISGQMRCGQCTMPQAERLAAVLKAYQVDITGTKGFDSAQATAGGVSVQEIDAVRMESKKIPGLYFAGEIVDVDAKCGGYHLQWAWSSGAAAGRAAASAAQTGHAGKKAGTGRKGVYIG